MRSWETEGRRVIEVFQRQGDGKWYWHLRPPARGIPIRFREEAYGPFGNEREAAEDARAWVWNAGWEIELPSGGSESCR